MLGCLDWWWLGVFYSPNHQNSRWGGLLSMGAPDTVRYANHVTQPLGFWRFRPLELWHLGAPDRPLAHRTGTVHCPVRLLALLWLCANCPRTVQLSVDRCVGEPLLCCHTGQSGDPPDSPVNYSGARPQKPEGEEFEVDPPWCTGQSGAPDQGSLRFLLLLYFEP
jgi:hypothetical protein